MRSLRKVGLCFNSCPCLAVWIGVNWRGMVSYYGVFYAIINGMVWEGLCCSSEHKRYVGATTAMRLQTGF